MSEDMGKSHQISEAPVQEKTGSDDGFNESISSAPVDFSPWKNSGGPLSNLDQRETNDSGNMDAAENEQHLIASDASPGRDQLGASRKLSDSHILDANAAAEPATATGDSLPEEVHRENSAGENLMHKSELEGDTEQPNTSFSKAMPSEERQRESATENQVDVDETTPIVANLDEHVEGKQAFTDGFPTELSVTEMGRNARDASNEDTSVLNSGQVASVNAPDDGEHNSLQSPAQERDQADSLSPATPPIADIASPSRSKDDKHPEVAATYEGEQDTEGLAETPDSEIKSGEVDVDAQGSEEESRSKHEDLTDGELAGSNAKDAKEELSASREEDSDSNLSSSGPQSSSLRKGESTEITGDEYPIESQSETQFTQPAKDASIASGPGDDGLANTFTVLEGDDAHDFGSPDAVISSAQSDTGLSSDVATGGQLDEEAQAKDESVAPLAVKEIPVEEASAIDSDFSPTRRSEFLIDDTTGTRNVTEDTSFRDGETVPGGRDPEESGAISGFSGNDVQSVTEGATPEKIPATEDGSLGTSTFSNAELERASFPDVESVDASLSDDNASARLGGIEGIPTGESASEAEGFKAISGHSSGSGNNVEVPKGAEQGIDDWLGRDLDPDDESARNVEPEYDIQPLEGVAHVPDDQQSLNVDRTSDEHMSDEHPKLVESDENTDLSHQENAASGVESLEMQEENEKPSKISEADAEDEKGSSVGVELMDDMPTQSGNDAKLGNDIRIGKDVDPVDAEPENYSRDGTSILQDLQSQRDSESLQDDGQSNDTGQDQAETWKDVNFSGTAGTDGVGPPRGGESRDDPQPLLGGQPGYNIEASRVGEPVDRAQLCNDEEVSVDSPGPPLDADQLSVNNGDPLLDTASSTAESSVPSVIAAESGDDNVKGVECSKTPPVVVETDFDHGASGDEEHFTSAKPDDSDERELTTDAPHAEDIEPSKHVGEQSMLVDESSSNPESRSPHPATESNDSPVGANVGAMEEESRIRTDQAADEKATIESTSSTDEKSIIEDESVTDVQPPIQNESVTDLKPGTDDQLPLDEQSITRNMQASDGTIAKDNKKPGTDDNLATLETAKDVRMDGEDVPEEDPPADEQSLTRENVLAHDEQSELNQASDGKLATNDEPLTHVDGVGNDEPVTATVNDPKHDVTAADGISVTEAETDVSTVDDPIVDGSSTTSAEPTLEDQTPSNEKTPVDDELISHDSLHRDSASGMDFKSGLEQELSVSGEDREAESLGADPVTPQSAGLAEPASKDDEPVLNAATEAEEIEPQSDVDVKERSDEPEKEGDVNERGDEPEKEGDLKERSDELEQKVDVKETSDEPEQEVDAAGKKDEPALVDEQEKDEPAFADEQEKNEPASIDEQENNEPAFIDEQENNEPAFVDDKQRASYSKLTEPEDIDTSVKDKDFDGEVLGKDSVEVGKNEDLHGEGIGTAEDESFISDESAGAVKDRGLIGDESSVPVESRNLSDESTGTVEDRGLSRETNDEILRDKDLAEDAADLPEVKDQSCSSSDVPREQDLSPESPKIAEDQDVREDPAETSKDDDHSGKSAGHAETAQVRNLSNETDGTMEDGDETREPAESETEVVEPVKASDSKDDAELTLDVESVKGADLEDDEEDTPDVEPVKAADLEDNEEDTPDVEPVKAADLEDNEEDTPDVEPVKAADSKDDGELTPNVESGKGANVEGDAEPTPEVEPVKAADSKDDAELTRDVESVKGADLEDDAELARDVESVKGADLEDDAEPNPDVEPVKAADLKDDAESEKAADLKDGKPTPDVELVQAADSSDTAEPALDAEPVEPANSSDNADPTLDAEPEGSEIPRMECGSQDESIVPGTDVFPEETSEPQVGTTLPAMPVDLKSEPVEPTGNDGPKPETIQPTMNDSKTGTPEFSNNVAIEDDNADTQMDRNPKEDPEVLRDRDLNEIDGGLTTVNVEESVALPLEGENAGPAEPEHSRAYEVEPTTNAELATEMDEEGEESVSHSSDVPQPAVLTDNDELRTREPLDDNLGEHPVGDDQSIEPRNIAELVNLPEAEHSGLLEEPQEEPEKQSESHLKEEPESHEEPEKRSDEQLKEESQPQEEPEKQSEEQLKEKPEPQDEREQQPEEQPKGDLNNESKALSKEEINDLKGEPEAQREDVLCEQPDTIPAETESSVIDTRSREGVRAHNHADAGSFVAVESGSNLPALDPSYEQTKENEPLDVDKGLSAFAADIAPVTENYDNETLNVQSPRRDGFDSERTSNPQDNLSSTNDSSAIGVGDDIEVKNSGSANESHSAEGIGDTESDIKSVESGNTTDIGDPKAKAESSDIQRKTSDSVDVNDGEIESNEGAAVPKVCEGSHNLGHSTDEATLPTNESSTTGSDVVLDNREFAGSQHLGATDEVSRASTDPETNFKDDAISTLEGLEPSESGTTDREDEGEIVANDSSEKSLFENQDEVSSRDFSVDATSGHGGVMQGKEPRSVMNPDDGTCDNVFMEMDDAGHAETRPSQTDVTTSDGNVQREEGSVPLSTHTSDLSSSWVDVSPFADTEVEPVPDFTPSTSQTSQSSRSGIEKVTNDSDWRIVSEQDLSSYPRANLESKPNKQDVNSESGAAKFLFSVVTWCGTLFGGSKR